MHIIFIVQITNTRNLYINIVTFVNKLNLKLIVIKLHYILVLRYKLLYLTIGLF